MASRTKRAISNPIDQLQENDRLRYEKSHASTPPIDGLQFSANDSNVVDIAVASSERKADIISEITFDNRNTVISRFENVENIAALLTEWMLAFSAAPPVGAEAVIDQYICEQAQAFSNFEGILQFIDLIRFHAKEYSAWENVYITARNTVQKIIRVAYGSKWIERD